MPTDPSPVTCPTCGAPAEVAELAEVAVAADAVVVRIQGLARATCGAGHVHLLPDRAAHHAGTGVRERFVVARTRGLLRRRERCGDCGDELILPPRQSDRPAPLDVGGRVLTILVESPMVRCPSCGRDQLPAAVGPTVDALVAAAVEQAATGGP